MEAAPVNGMCSTLITSTTPRYIIILHIMFQPSDQHQYNNYGDMVYSFALLSTKLSIMLLIQRVFCSVQRDIAYWLTTFLMFANTAFYTAFLIGPAAQCIPRSKIWNMEEPGTCVDINKLYVASAVFNLLSDVAMLSVPIFMIWGLQMSIRRKIGVSAIFATGGLYVLPLQIQIGVSSNI